MPGMTGVELLKRVYERFPETVRIILTGFADSEATIKAINDGHIYGYVNKPWEPDELKTIVRRAVELHAPHRREPSPRRGSAACELLPRCGDGPAADRRDRGRSRRASCAR